MMRLKHLLLALAFVLLTGGCTDTPSETASLTADGSAAVDSSDGVSPSSEPNEASGSSDVGYYNPNTGHSADYTLDVERNSDGSADRINFPNGGWEDDFVDQQDNGDGTVTVIDEDGREFTVGSDD